MNTKNLRVSLLASVIAAAVAGPAFAAGQAPLEVRPMPAPAAEADAGTRLIVKYRDKRAAPAVKAQSVQAAAKRALGSRLVRNSAAAGATAPEARHVRTMSIGSDVVKLSRKLDAAQLDAVIRELRADPAVERVEVDRMVHHTGVAQVRSDVQPSLVPDDPYYAQYNWHLQDTPGGIHAEDAWDVSTGEGTVVAVVDTGIVPHPDMDANMLEGYDFISDAFVSRRDTDDRVPGAYDYGDWNDDAAECRVSTSSFHGTHVAGTVAELTNNGLGMAGTAHDAQVLPLRVLGRCGGYTSDVVDAVVWAAGGEVPGIPMNENPAEVINLSLGGSGACLQSEQDAFALARSLGSLVVTSAGNSNADVSNFSPANCDNVMVVAAGRINGGRASYSNYGSLVHLTAPGGGGSADGNPNGYVWQASNSSDTSPDLGDPTYVGMSGTSMASPHVAGVAAMVQSAVVAAGGDPLSPAELQELLIDSVRPFPSNPDRPIGAGLLDAPGALELALGSDPGDPGDPGEPDAIELTNGVALTGLSGSAGSSTLYSIEVPAGESLLSVVTYGGRGDVSVYVSAGEAPTVEDHDRASTRPGNNETVRIVRPEATTYYILVVGERAFSGVSLQARH
ncbi:protease [Lysobacter defluvii IMMIB APB-9 = DSM 18482]|uniref:Protease n=1 Tax=Lysobacter defluvii IMMIB APB-9 = DSM 18482 TaxID=1385515 RepID=A0A0A0MA84_9GAMM|nr:protease [Lysobacter defluvii IMMIB APB-9 = DSM 18482]